MDDLEKLLDVTRQVFSGELRRGGLKKLPTRQKVFIGTAIMLAVGEPYMLANNVVHGSYGEHLKALTEDGLINYFDEADDKYGVDAIALRDMAARLGLYRRMPGRGRGKPTILTPQPEMVALVERLGRTEAIDRFLEEVAASPEIMEDWRDYYRLRNGLDPDTGRSQLIKRVIIRQP